MSLPAGGHWHQPERDLHAATPLNAPPLTVDRMAHLTPRHHSLSRSRVMECLLTYLAIDSPSSSLISTVLG